MKRIAIGLPKNTGYFRLLIRGIFHYSHHKKDWALSLTGSTMADDHLGKGWDGVITMKAPSKALAKDEKTKFVTASSLPKIFLHPSVDVDDILAGHQAAEHFLGQGFQHFAFAGCKNAHYSDQRRQGFTESLEKAGFSCHTLDLYQGIKKDSGEYLNHQTVLQQWLQQLPLPIGLFCCADVEALMVLGQVQTLGIRIPEDIAIIGAENDDMLCELPSPPLSSVDLNAERLGMLSAQTLDTLLMGGQLPSPRQLVKPLGVVERSSTQKAVEHPGVRTALAFFRQAYAQNIGVPDAAEAAGITRRALEIAFKNALGKSPRESLEEIRLGHAKALLKQTDLPIQEVAFRCGFNSASRFSVVFQQRLHLSPQKFRTDKKGS